MADPTQFQNVNVFLKISTDKINETNFLTVRKRLRVTEFVKLLNLCTPEMQKSKDYH